MSRTFQKVSKEDFVREIKWHQEQDRIIQGSYGDEFKGGEEFKGCFMGCAVNSIARINGDKLSHEDHKEQADYLGLPEWFVYLYENIFEGLSVDDSKKFVVDCAEAIPECDTKEIGKLESLIKIFIIESTKKYHDNEEIKGVVDLVAEAIRSENEEQLELADSAAWSAWSAARSAAESAAAWSAAWSADSAARSAAWSAAESAAESAKYAAESAARSAAWSAARSAARSAESSWSVWSVWSAAESAKYAAYKELADYVLDLLKGV